MLGVMEEAEEGVGVGVGGSDELHFLLAVDRATAALSPINRLKDKGVS